MKNKVYAFFNGNELTDFSDKPFQFSKEYISKDMLIEILTKAEEEGRKHGFGVAFTMVYNKILSA